MRSPRKPSTVKNKSLDAAEVWQPKPPSEYLMDMQREIYAEAWEAGFWAALKDISGGTVTD